MASAAHQNPLPPRFVATSSAMLAVLQRVDAYARARTPIVLAGATGTGKTTVAELVHTLSGRSGALVTQSAGEFDPSLERSQLFGHERGAFTGAVDRHAGLLEQAADGTLLLDDFHHVGRSTQIALLRALDRGAFRRVGGCRDLPVRCRVLIGLTDDPDRVVERGGLLPELRFRLGYSTIHLPSLEERREDIPALAQQFLSRCPDETGAPGPRSFAPEVVSVLRVAQWPGNLRQLGMTVRDAYLRARQSELVYLHHLSDLVSLPVQFRRRGPPHHNATAIRAALEITHGQVGDAARLLHTSRTTIYSYRGTLGLTDGLLDPERTGLPFAPRPARAEAGR